MTLDQACILTGLTGRTFATRECFNDFLKYASKILGKDLLVHELCIEGVQSKIIEDSRKIFEENYESFNLYELAYAEYCTGTSLLRKEDKHILDTITKCYKKEDIWKKMLRTCFPKLNENELNEILIQQNII